MSCGPRRSDTICPIFGSYSKKQFEKLPTIKDVVILMQYHYEELKKITSKKTNISKVFSKIYKEVEHIWLNTAIPILTKERVMHLLKKISNKYIFYRKYPTSKKGDKFRTNLAKYIAHCESSLFDIAACKCTTFQKCNCSHEKMVPLDQRNFLTDQRNDRVLTVKKEKRLQFKKRLEQRITNREAPKLTTSAMPEIQILSMSPLAKLEKKHNTLALPNVAKTCDRYGLSMRSAAAITSAVLMDVGIISDTDNSLVIDKNKIHRALATSRKNITLTQNKVKIQGLYFDGRKDITLQNEKHNGRYYRKTVKEEHVSVIAEPNSQYVGHVTPSSGTAKAICDSIMELVNDNVDDIMCVGCDGTVVNTGRKGGVIERIETHLGRPLQWVVCLLHLNELPLRHLFIKLDGATTGPRGYSGPIGAALLDCEKTAIVLFTPINGNIPDMEKQISDEMSTEQKYMFEMCQAIKSGHCPQELGNRQPGKIAHSRWVTTANRIMRLYVGSINPSQNLKILVKFIMMVYAPIWFFVKYQSSLQFGAQHVFKMISFSRFLPPHLKSCVDSVIQRNSFFAHPENLLVAMLFDTREHIRNISLNRIIQARNNGGSSSVRTFNLPVLNFFAEDYTEMIDWKNCDITPPPFLSKISDKNLQIMVKNNCIELPNLPCHTQSVERCVKLVTQASLSVVDPESRDGLIRNRIQSRKEMPAFEFKKHFFSNR